MTCVGLLTLCDLWQLVGDHSLAMVREGGGREGHCILVDKLYLEKICEIMNMRIFSYMNRGKCL